MIATHTIEEIRFNQDTMVVKIDGKEVKFQLDKISAKLKEATEVERNVFKISPSGYGIHWPLLDEDLSIDSLLKIKLS